MTSDAVGHRISALRTALGLSQAELARRAQVSKGYLSKLERQGGVRPGGEVLERLAAALDVRVTDLLDQPPAEAAGVPESLTEYAMSAGLDNDMLALLASIQWRGERPSSVERWRFLHLSVVLSRDLDGTPTWRSGTAAPIRRT
jgi:transcriptional regulator with XRE-family HTH domain